MKKIRKRLGFDIALGLLLIFEMLYTLTGNVLHELVGVVFFATMAAHLVFARKWSGSMVRSLKERQKLPGEQKARLVIAIALALCAVALAAARTAATAATRQMTVAPPVLMAPTTDSPTPATVPVPTAATAPRPIPATAQVLMAATAAPLLISAPYAASTAP